MTTVPTRPGFARAQARDWTALSARLGLFIDSLIDRDDVVAHIGVDATPLVDGTRPPGVFHQTTGTVTIDAAQTLAPHAQPCRIDLRDRRDCATHATLAGVLAHEAGHAAHTAGRGCQRASTEKWTALLEEPRMEARLVESRPVVRTWLQASATEIVGVRDPVGPGSAAAMLILLGGRITAGVLDAEDLPDLSGMASVHLTGAQIDVITAQTTTAVGLADGDIDGLVACAEKIASALAGESDGGDDGDGDDRGAGADAAAGDADNATGDADDSMSTDRGVDSVDSTSSAGSTSTGSPHTGRNDGPDGDGDTGGGDAGWVWHDNDDHGASPTTDDNGGNDAEHGDDGVVAQALAAIAAAARRDARIAAGIRTSTSADLQARRDREAHADRTATAADRADTARHDGRFVRVTADLLGQSRRLNRALAAASDRGVAVTHHHVDAPPGRLRMDRLVRRHGQIAAGLTPTATPWVRTRRRIIDRPPLAVGIAIDSSPSMGAAMQPAAEAAWLMQRAAHSRRGHTATVTWHSTVAALPHTPAGDQMYVPEAGGLSSCALPDAIDAVDGKLGYAHADGARLLCIITDTQLPNLEDVQRRVTRLHTLGVGVMWLTIPTGGAITVLDHVAHVHADVPATIGAAISAAAVKALRHA